MSLLDRIFPARARQRAELDAARVEYARSLADLHASRLEVEAEADANIAALDDALADARRVAAVAESASLSPPASTQDNDATE